MFKLRLFFMRGVLAKNSGSFLHTVVTAIEKKKGRACECGANNVYIQAQDAGTLGTASVTLVGVRFTSAPLPISTATPEPVDRKKKIDNAKKCPVKGGVWLNGKCEIEIDLTTDSIGGCGARSERNSKESYYESAILRNQE